MPDLVKYRRPSIGTLKSAPLFASEHGVSSSDVQLCPSDLFTTVMIRNIPCRYTQAQIMIEVGSITLNFDFLYLPPARTAKFSKNLGYAFVNFRTAADAQLFISVFQDYEFALYKNSSKRAKVSYADLQGFEQNLKSHRKSGVVRTKFRPFIAKARTASTGSRATSSSNE